MSTATQPPSTATRTLVVLVADKLDPEAATILQDAGIEVRVQPSLSPEALLAAAADVDGILVRSAAKVTAAVIDAAPRLKAVGRAGIGVDNIDVAAASRRGIVVMNTPTANAVTTGELALAHLFSLARRIPEAHESMRQGRWDKSKLVGTEITSKTLGVVGLGKIGRVVAERAVGLGMHVVAYDPFLKGESPVPGVTLVKLDALLRGSDFITLHVPKGKDTLGLIDAAALAKMKPTAYLINCARGGIVVEDDLCAALKAGALAGAALDVFATEPLPADSPLRDTPHLVLTPHLGASSEEAQKRVSTEIAQQMADYLLNDEARCALNAAAVPPETLAVLRPYITLARRLGLIAAQVAEAPAERVEIEYIGHVADHDTKPVRAAALAGLLAPSLDGPVNVVNAEMIAHERGLKVMENHDASGRSDYAALLKVRVFDAEGRQHMAGGSVFRGQPRLMLFEDVGVDFAPEGHLLMTRHDDAPGVLGQMAGVLGELGVNIGGMHMAPGASPDQPALALFGIDRALSADEERRITDLPALRAARSITL